MQGFHRKHGRLGCPDLNHTLGDTAPPGSPSSKAPWHRPTQCHLYIRPHRRIAHAGLPGVLRGSHAWHKARTIATCRRSRWGQGKPAHHFGATDEFASASMPDDNGS